MTSTAALRQEDQSLWLDYIRRSLLTSGRLQRLIEEDQLRGLTSNPSIFQEAIADSGEYDGDLKALLEARPGATAEDIYETIAVEEIRRACDLLRPVYDETGTDGLVSLEVSPHLARDTEGTIREARRLWGAVGRPNLMIKVPATDEGIPAIEQLIGEGINVNITLMFSMDHYEATAEAYLRGLERAAASGAELGDIHSVASFFVSRVSRKVDAALEDLQETGDAPGFHGGDVAIANAKMAYQRFKEIFHEGERFAALEAQGALVQRPLWASTSTKNPAYSDVLYVEELIGPETVNTVPPQTLEAFRDHGTVRGATIEEDLDRAREILDALPDWGIDLDWITTELQEEGVEKFSDPFDELIDAIREQQQALEREAAPSATYALGRLEDHVEERLKAWNADDFARRLWERDPTLWGSEDTPELTDRLGWLGLPMAMDEEAGRLEAFARRVKDDVDDVVVCGMGGSSLAPEVFSKVFGSAEGFPRLTVLDSTHPDAVRALEEQLDLKRTLFVIASKSGTTTETLSFFRYFFAKLGDHTDAPGTHFVAITDPGSALAELGAERGFRRVFTAPPDVGGRYSALTPFGLVPAALIGADVHALLSRARRMAESSGAERPAPENAGLRLGAILGEAARAGRDKVTFSTSPALWAFPGWLEQLIAESTGKDGAGIIPVAGEPLGAPGVYSDDRLFVHFQLEGDVDDQAQQLDALEVAGHPVLRIRLTDRADLAREMFRWEVAVAAAGAALGIHPFNQPNVEAAKRLAKEAMQKDGRREADDLDETPAGMNPEAVAEAVRRWLREGSPGDYISVQAYLAPSKETTGALRQLVHMLRNGTGRATTLGYGPRFLHSTGQLHKGGPNTVHVLQLVDAPLQDVAVPETDFSFGELIRAQSIGDHRALREANRRVRRVHLGEDPAGRLDALLDAAEKVTAKAAA